MTVHAEFGSELAEAAVLDYTNTQVILEYFITGSVAFNGQGNDLDVVCLVRALPPPCSTNSGWVLCGEESYESQGMFIALRKGDVNLILCEDAEYYRAWATAKEVCLYLSKVHSMTTRDVRVAIHKMIVDCFDADDI